MRRQTAALPHHTHPTRLLVCSPLNVLSPLRDRALVGDQLGVEPVRDDEPLLVQLQKFLAAPAGEAVLLGGEDKLPAGELELGTAQLGAGLGHDWVDQW